MAAARPPLPTRTLGDTAVPVTAVGLGCAPLAGLYTPVDPAVAAATVDAAWNGGVRHFDTAPQYGAGLSEQRLGGALAERPREAFTLSTKMGRVLVDHEGPWDIWGEPNGKAAAFDFSYRAAFDAHLGSLERLGTDRVEVGLIHDADDHRAEALAGTHRALTELKAAGRIGAIGIGMNSTEAAADLVSRAHFDVALIAGRYTLLDQSALERLYPLCLSRGVSVIAAGVFNSGILADPRPGARFNYAAADQRLLARAQAMAAICDRHDVPLRAAALQFPAAHPAVASILVGARTPAEVEDALAMYAHPIPGALWHDLKRAGLLAEEAPVPS
ncbi:aldo/keto reductase [Glycomyces sp. TRM65418]|uniref:aldo/keto reductase n=1 Tax=Glycomyces sp. TRM65418 TaxID=2867006 RepID=UPI001CE566D2|nr:aldo/keto reductase [Glycomyces sp. TRM65418]MCC3764061.1 aldo/keto reductase [Glycomyces sp. TRM65418]QZD53752.1 aldo/keto reductase [Glycomyces sp. TRM65418]